MQVLCQTAEAKTENKLQPSNHRLDCMIIYQYSTNMLLQNDGAFKKKIF